MTSIAVLSGHNQKDPTLLENVRFIYITKMFNYFSSPPNNMDEYIIQVPSIY